MRLTTVQRGARDPAPRHSNFERWTIEELRAFGEQMQLRDARRKTRGELLELLGVDPPERRV